MNIRRRGISLLEQLAATVVVAALLSAVAQLAIFSAGQRLEMERRMLAVCEAQRIVEQISAMNFADIDEQALRQLQLSDNAAQALPDGKLTSNVAAEQGKPMAKRVIVEIHWQSQSGSPIRPVQLTTWRFAGGGA